MKTRNPRRLLAACLLFAGDPLAGFYAAEQYHQHYVERHPESMYVAINDLPKLKRLRAQFPSLYRGENPD